MFTASRVQKILCISLGLLVYSKCCAPLEISNIAFSRNGSIATGSNVSLHVFFQYNSSRNYLELRMKNTTIQCQATSVNWGLCSFKNINGNFSFSNSTSESLLEVTFKNVHVNYSNASVQLYTKVNSTVTYTTEKIFPVVKDCKTNLTPELQMNFNDRAKYGVSGTLSCFQSGANPVDRNFLEFTELATCDRSADWEIGLDLSDISCWKEPAVELQSNYSVTKKFISGMQVDFTCNCTEGYPKPTVQLQFIDAERSDIKIYPPMNFNIDVESGVGKTIVLERSVVVVCAYNVTLSNGAAYRNSSNSIHIAVFYPPVNIIDSSRSENDTTLVDFIQVSFQSNLNISTCDIYIRFVADDSNRHYYGFLQNNSSDNIYSNVTSNATSEYIYNNVTIPSGIAQDLCNYDFVYTCNLTGQSPVQGSKSLRRKPCKPLETTLQETSTRTTTVISTEQSEVSNSPFLNTEIIIAALCGLIVILVGSIALVCWAMKRKKSGIKEEVENPLYGTSESLMRPEEDSKNKKKRKPEKPKPSQSEKEVCVNPLYGETSTSHAPTDLYATVNKDKGEVNKTFSAEPEAEQTYAVVNRNRNVKKEKNASDSAGQETYAEVKKNVKVKEKKKKREARTANGPSTSIDEGVTYAAVQKRDGKKKKGAAAKSQPTTSTEVDETCTYAVVKKNDKKDDDEDLHGSSKG